MVQTLQRRHQTVLYLGAKDEGHGFHKAENATLQQNAQIAFLK